MTLREIKGINDIDLLLKLYNELEDIELRREVVSQIGRQDDDRVYKFIRENVFTCGYMDLVYQMYRTCLYKNYSDLGAEIRKYFNNEVLNKMYLYTKKEKPIHKNIYKEPILLRGDNKDTLKTLEEYSVHLIFTSPPYYNARIYSNYKSYNDYLRDMKETFKLCNRVLEPGRFMVVNVSPIITRRPGREFESTRYPIHYDFHNILQESGFYFIDEIYWVKPEYTVKNRNGGYQQTKMPLSYKPNTITESIMVYRKNCNFLLDKNIKLYDKSLKNDNKIDTNNLWYIHPAKNKNHPAVFPKELCEKVLKYYSFKGDTVLDPFAGAGTFGAAALEMDRIPILCEKNNEYCNIIQNSILKS